LGIAHTEEVSHRYGVDIRGENGKRWRNMNSQTTSPDLAPRIEKGDLSLDFLGHGEHLLLVPKKTASHRHEVADILPQSGIVAAPWPGKEGAFEVDYEGNLYESPTLERFEERVKTALRRQISHYPTSSKLSMSREEIETEFEIVGIARVENPNAGAKIQVELEIFPDKAEILTSWQNQRKGKEW
jgi:hypothetical protein